MKTKAERITELPEGFKEWLATSHMTGWNINNKDQREAMLSGFERRNDPQATQATQEEIDRYIRMGEEDARDGFCESYIDFVRDVKK